MKRRKNKKHYLKQITHWWLIQSDRQVELHGICPLILVQSPGVPAELLTQQTRYINQMLANAGPAS